MIGLEFIRKKHKFTLQEIANKLGVSKQMVSQWEKQRKDISSEKLVLLSTIFNISQEFLKKQLNKAEELELEEIFIKKTDVVENLSFIINQYKSLDNILNLLKEYICELNGIENNFANILDEVKWFNNNDKEININTIKINQSNISINRDLLIETQFKTNIMQIGFENNKIYLKFNEDKGLKFYNNNKCISTQITSKDMNKWLKENHIKRGTYSIKYINNDTYECCYIK